MYKSRTASRYMTTPKKRFILAPCNGRTIAITKVPDPVFSEKMTGDGLAILAESDEILAPCTGKITLFFATKHAFAITTDDGIQVLVHVGLNTVILDGKGITALHQPGDHVQAGEPVLELDLDYLKKNDINLISPVIIVNYDKVNSLHSQPAGEKVHAGEDEVLDFAV
jgi:PTS system D-glucosamine-specific IIA component/PTS system glucose-specific IIA component